MTEVEAYHEMYLTMARAAKQAIRLLVEAQQACETLYICLLYTSDAADE